MAGDLARRLWPLNRLVAAWQHDFDIGSKPLRKDLRRLQSRIEQLEALLTETVARADHGDRLAEQIQYTLRAEERDRDWLSRLPALLDHDRIASHATAAVARAPWHTDPFEHIVVEQLFPEDTYELILAALPPPAFFDNRDPIKRDLRLPVEFGPELVKRVWRFFDEDFAARLLRSIVVERFQQALDALIDDLFGAERRDEIRRLPPMLMSGRLALRRPGYHLAPHRDPKHSMITCLIYLARPGDSEEYGTRLYRVDGDREAHHKQTYFPEAAGARCELAKTVPYRPNTMLAFLNARGAHGAEIPRDALSFDRYTYQFYVAAEPDALGNVIRSLPPERRRLWQSKSRD